jgi:hypothetical protein
MFAVLAIFGLGIVIVAFGRWRKGLFVVAVGLLLGGFLRLVLPARRAGVLVVRSRITDVVTLATLGAAVLLLAAVIPNPLTR